MKKVNCDEPDVCKRIVFNSIPRALADKHAIPVGFLRAAPLPWQTYLSLEDTRMDGNPRNSHVQDYFELIVYINGSLGYFAENSVYRPSHGDIMIFSPGEQHKSIQYARDGYRRFYLLMNPALAGLLADGEYLTGCFTGRAPGERNLLRLPPDVRRRLIKRLEACFPSSQDEGLPSLRRNAVLELLYEVNRGFRSGSGSGAGQAGRYGGDIPPMLHEILTYINENITSIKNAEEVAARFRISPSYAARLFRSIEISPYQYIQMRRLLAARRMLDEGRSVTEACYDAGFSDCSRFIIYFRRQLGCTPHEYAASRGERGSGSAG